MRPLTVVRVGGLSLIAGAFLFIAVFTYLALAFNYPNILDGTANDVLPQLLATGRQGRAVWAIYGFLPLAWIPASVGAFHALRGTSEGSMRVAMAAGFLSSIAMILGLLRWPTIHWELAQAYAGASATERVLISSLFAGFNLYLGNYIGEFLGELAISVFFLLSAMTILRPTSGFPRWSGYLGLLAGVVGITGMFRNVTDSVDPVAAFNNYLLPLWMVAFGILLLRRS